MIRKKIQKGHTNVSFREGDIFLQEKIYNEFNHKINYDILKQFNFVPKLISQNNIENKWKFIEGETPKITNDLLIKIANCLKEVHNSKLIFPPFNIAARIKTYREIMWKKNIKN